MAIILVQKNGSASTGTLDATPPAWSPATTAGNLLVVIGCEVNGTNNTWPTAPAGYTSFPNTPFIHYNSGITGVHGGYAKIAAGSDATPGHYGETSGTQDWVTYTYEFSVPGGWVNATTDLEQHTAQSITQFTTKPSGGGPALAQAIELAIVMSAQDVAVTALSYASLAYTTAQPTTNNGKLWMGWLETSSVTNPATTASWTTLARSGIRIVSFKPVVGSVSQPKLRVVRRVGCGA